MYSNLDQRANREICPAIHQAWGDRWKPNWKWTRKRFSQGYSTHVKFRIMSPWAILLSYWETHALKLQSARNFAVVCNHIHQNESFCSSLEDLSHWPREADSISNPDVKLQRKTFMNLTFQVSKETHFCVHFYSTNLVFTSCYKHGCFVQGHHLHVTAMPLFAAC